MFTVEVYSVGKAHSYFDSMATTDAIGPSSTTTVFNISNPTYSQDPTGMDFVFTTGQNRSYGSTVVSYTTDASGNVDSVTVSDPMPYVPSAGDEFMLVDTSSLSERWLIDNVYEVVSGRFSLTAELGCASIDAVIRPLYGNGVDISGGALLRRVVVRDVFGHLLWDGLVDEYAQYKDELRIKGSGFGTTFSRYRYGVDWPASPTTTTRSVLVDIIKANPLLDHASTEYVDYKVRDSGTSSFKYELEDAQSTMGNGIGPFEFSESSPSASDAIRTVLRYGKMPLEPKALYLQFYGPSTYWTRDVGDYRSAHYWALPEISKVRDEFLFISKGVSGKYNRLRVRYQSDGINLSTTPVYDLRSLVDFGVIEYVESTDEAGAARLVAEWRAGMKSYVVFSGTVSVSGLLRRGSAYGVSVPAYMIRPLDRLTISGIIYMGNIDFFVGNVSVDMKSGAVTVAPIEYVDPIEFVSQYIDMET